MITLGTDKLLNPTLYMSLKGTFASVKILSMGVSMQYSVVVDPARSGRRLSIIIHEWGESYKVCCPKCNDRKFRLLVNHRHGTYEPDSGMPFGNKVRCFNESCDHSDFDDRYLKPYMRKGKIVVPASTEEVGQLSPAMSPGHCSKIPRGGEVESYLRGRKGGGFDPNMLEEKYNVCYCYDASEDYPSMTGRLVIPIYFDNVMVGWQGRAVNNYVTPKYYTMPGFPKGRVLYNFDAAKQKPFVVVCEGVFDVMRVGDCAVAVLGSTITSTQQKLLYYNWKQGAMLIMFDPDDAEAQERAQRMVQACREKESFSGGVANIVLPSGTDPADMTHDEVWQEIYNQCKQQQIRLH